MAVGNSSIVQQPNANIGATRNKLPVITNWTPILPFTIKNDNIAGLYFFKFVLEVRLTSSTGILLGLLKQRKNAYPADVTANDGRAIFDIKDIVNTQLENTITDPNSTTPEPIHFLGINVPADPFGVNNNQILTIYLKSYVEYASSEGASPAADTTAGVVEELTNLYMNASLPLHTERSATINFQGDAFDAYQLNGSSGKFLSDLKLEYHEAVGSSVYATYVHEDDCYTLGFLNGKADDASTEYAFDSDLRYLHIKYYDSTGAEINPGTVKKLSNSNSYGGCKPDLGDTSPQLSDDNERLIYVGCGPANLQVQSYDTDAKPSNNSGWAYYKVYGVNTAGTANTTADYYFIRQDGSCKGYEVRRLAWINSLGCWDYFNFTMKSSQTVDISRINYESMLGEYNSDQYSYNNYDGGKRVMQTTAILKETINTDWITEDQAYLIEKLFLSTFVQKMAYGTDPLFTPVLIKEKSIARKTVANDGIRIKYTIKIEYAHPINTNS